MLAMLAMLASGGPKLKFAHASSTHGMHMRIVHALLADVDVGSQILETFTEFPTQHLQEGGGGCGVRMRCRTDLGDGQQA